MHFEGLTFNGRKSDDPAWGVTAFRSRPLGKRRYIEMFCANGKGVPGWKVAEKVWCEGSKRVKSSHRRRPISSTKTMPHRAGGRRNIGLAKNISEISVRERSVFHHRETWFLIRPFESLANSVVKNYVWTGGSRVLATALKNALTRHERRRLMENRSVRLHARG